MHISQSIRAEESEMSKAWWKAALIRMVRTIAQGSLAAIGTSAVVLSDVNWLVVASTAAMAGVLSLLMSLAGLPEVPKDET